MRRAHAESLGGLFPHRADRVGPTDGWPAAGPDRYATVAKMLATKTVPAKGKVVPVTIPGDASKFKHRGELVYHTGLFRHQSAACAARRDADRRTVPTPPPTESAAGNAVATIDEFAAKHGGNAPVFIFADSGGNGFNNDTEYVNGVQGNAADHLTLDVRRTWSPISASAMTRRTGASWAQVSGGTCALNLRP